MNREFSLGFVIGLVLFATNKMFYFIHLKEPFLVIGLTLMLGLSMVNLSESLFNFIGLALAYCLGSFVMMHANYGSIYGLSSGFQFNETIKMMVLENNAFILWFIGFPAGFYMRPYVVELFSQPKPKSVKKSKELGTKETRPLFLSLRDQPSELHTSPSIHIN